MKEEEEDGKGRGDTVGYRRRGGWVGSGRTVWKGRVEMIT